jgi:GNAT superfamily N-acetyltransferase
VTDAELAARQHASHVAFYEGMATRIEHVGGVRAAVTPSVPDRSLPNAVLYEDPGDVVAALPELERLYAEAGVRAWTVWVHPGDDDLAAALAQAGHAHDGQPMGMAAALDELDLEPRRELDVEQVSDWPLFGALNDRAYGITGLADVLGAFRAEGARGWLARVDGEPACCVTIAPHEGDAYVCLVATVPEFRGRGLFSELMRHALRAARDTDGCTTTTLEGSPMGEPVYDHMGYRPLGRFGLWERRSSNESA